MAKCLCGKTKQEDGSTDVNCEDWCENQPE